MGEPQRTTMGFAQRSLAEMLKKGATETVGVTALGAYRRLLRHGLAYRAMQAECFYALPEFLTGAAATAPGSIASSVSNELAHLEAVISDFADENGSNQQRFN